MGVVWVNNAIRVQNDKTRSVIQVRCKFIPWGNWSRNSVSKQLLQSRKTKGNNQSLREKHFFNWKHQLSNSNFSVKCLFCFLIQRCIVAKLQGDLLGSKSLFCKLKTLKMIIWKNFEQSSTVLKNVRQDFSVWSTFANVWTFGPVCNSYK